MNLKKLIRETINDFLNEEKGKDINLKNTIFITYGLGDSFDKNKFAPPVTDTTACMFYRTNINKKPDNEEAYKHYGAEKYANYSYNALDFNKPQFGLWAAPVNSEYGWKEYLVKYPQGRGEKKKQLTTHFMFKLKRDAKIYIIDDIEDLYKVIRLKSQYTRESFKYQLDFTPLIEEGYDGVFVTRKAIEELGDDALNFWSIESICIFNKDAIVPYEESPFETAEANDFKDITNDFAYNDDKGNNNDRNFYYEDEYADKHHEDYENDDEYIDSQYWRLANRKKKNQIDRTLELYGNQNVHPDMSRFFKGRHPGILAQMKGNSKDARMARDFDGTIGSVVRKKG